jgi:hypothetical protein
MTPPNLFCPPPPAKKARSDWLRALSGWLLAEKEREGFNLLTQDGQATEQERATHWI